METILELDHSLFFFFHESCKNVILDMIMPFFRERSSWYVLYAAILVWIFYKFRLKKGLIVTLGLIATVAICDFTSGKVLKKMIKRPRPCHVDSSYDKNVRSLVRCGSGYSMPSSHASNHFGIAFYLILIGLFKRRFWKVLILIWAGLIGIAQIYVGLHFPGDVIFGGGLGFLVAYLVRRIVDYISPKVL